VPASSNNTWNAATVVAGSTGYRLPTEAQWQYAAQGGGSTTVTVTDATGWYDSNSNNMTHEVGKKNANAYGLHDILGNVWEWCWDWYGSTYPSGATDPRGAASGNFRVLRGGCWYYSSGSAGSGYRINNSFPSGRSNRIGFRLVRPFTSSEYAYTIYFNQNGGDTEADPQTKIVTSPATNVGSLPEAPTRTGYTFTGWNTAANGSGAAFIATTTVTASITVYAQWQWVVQEITSDTGIYLVSIPSGTFTVNGTAVTLSSFYMGKYEVTQEQWQAVMENNPSDFSSNPASGEVQGKRPVETVRWYDAIVFCNRLSIMEGLTPAYSIGGSTNPDSWGTVPTDSDSAWDAATVVAGSTGYRLPTEAQWQYAARGAAAQR
jgi:uncharacterized repeat protein (TIGR02543 family)